MRRTSVSLRAVVQRALAVTGLSVLLLSGSAAVASAAPHFSTGGPLTTSVGPGPSPQIMLQRNGVAAAGLSCPGLRLNAGTATINTVGPVGFNTTTACSGSDGYTYTVTTSTVASAPLLYNGSKFYFNMSGVSWQINGGPGNLQRSFYPLPYTIDWLNPTPPAVLNSRLFTYLQLGGTILPSGYWTGSVVGYWNVSQNGNLITALQ